MSDGTSMNDMIISAMELAQKWVDDVSEDEPPGSAEDLIERRHKLYKTAFDGIIETILAGATKLTGRRQRHVYSLLAQHLLPLGQPEKRVGYDRPFLTLVRVVGP